VERRRRSLAGRGDGSAAFAETMEGLPIALHTDLANRQHYELPPRFFELTLGARRNYSCGYYPTGRETLDEAELLALEEVLLHADLRDGQHILELGCGWGSLSLLMAERLPGARSPPCPIPRFSAAISSAWPRRGASPISPSSRAT
jgi:cyclopropane-fatty-acyl-phospholipid synthase